MKRALVVWFFVAALVAMGCGPVPDTADSIDSVGTLQDSNSWIEIWDWYDLDDVRNNLSGSYILMTDLDSTTPGYDELAAATANDGKGWEPLVQFKGSLDGQGYEIRDLFIDRPDEDHVGLVGYIDTGAVVKRLGLLNASVVGHWFVGILAGRNPTGTIDNCYSVGSVFGDAFVGLLAGSTGQTEASVMDSHSIGTVNGTTSYIGGLTGFNRGTITNCYSSAIVGSGSATGGLVGGNHLGTILNCYSTGRVTAGWPGGLVGWNNAGAITNCYSTAEVIGRDGGLVGTNSHEGTVDNSFWDTETSGQSASEGGTGKTTAEMKDIATFLDAGWDIAITTLGDPTEGYPFLSWQLEGSPTWLIHEETPTQCVESATGTGEVCFTTSNGFIEDLQAIPPHSLPSVLFPHGMFNFRITDLTPGQTVTLTIEFPSPLPIGTLWWKYDNGRWYGLPNESDNGDNIMVISLTDGGVHDLDDIPGQITDPGGPGNPMTVGWEGYPASKVGVAWPWIALVGAAAAASLLMMRRRRFLN